MTALGISWASSAKHSASWSISTYYGHWIYLSVYSSAGHGYRWSKWGSSCYSYRGAPPGEM